MDKVFGLSLLLLFIFAWFDVNNLIAIKMIDSQWQNSNALWTIFSDIISPAAYWMWIGVLAVIGMVWYVYSKDKSESWAIFLSPAILIMFGVQDLIYYALSPDTLVGTVGCWADVMFPIRVISDFLGETCPTANSFILSAIIGVGLSYWTYNKLKKAKW